MKYVSLCSCWMLCKVYFPIPSILGKGTVIVLCVVGGSSDGDTVEPPRKGHFGELSFVLFSEVVLILTLSALRAT